jgi:hypothetical protein
MLKLSAANRNPCKTAGLKTGSSSVGVFFKDFAQISSSFFGWGDFVFPE